jgi:hypothetical protein
VKDHDSSRGQEIDKGQGRRVKANSKKESDRGTEQKNDK